MGSYFLSFASAVLETPEVSITEEIVALINSFRFIISKANKNTYNYCIYNYLSQIVPEL